MLKLNTLRPTIANMIMSKLIIPKRQTGSEGVREFKVTRVYCDEEGKSKFAEFNINMLPSGEDSIVSKTV